MRKSLLLTIGILFLSVATFAVNASWNYTISTAASSPISMTGATNLGLNSGSWDDGGSALNWPFNFQVYDQSYSTANQLTFNTNGIMRFDGSIYAGSYGTGVPIPTSISSYGNFLSYGGNTDGRIESTNGIYYLVSGTAPNRVLTIAFTYYTNYTGTSSYHADVQISFYEANQNIEVDYSNVGGSNTMAGDLGINAGDGVFGNVFGNFPTSATRVIYTPGSSITAPQAFAAAVASSCQIDLSWTKNTTGDDVIVAYNTINSFGTPANGITYTAGSSTIGSAQVLYVGSATSFSHQNLPSGTAHYYKIWSKSATNIYSTSALTDNKTTNAVLVPTSFAVSGATSTQIDLSWDLNAFGDNVMLTYNTVNSFVPPTNGTSYTVGNKIGGQQTVLYKGSLTAFQHSGLTVNTTYYYKIWSYGCQGDYSSTGATLTQATSTTSNPTISSITAPSSCEINMAWTKNTSGDNVMILRNTTNSFGTPSTGTPYTLGYIFPAGGTVVYSGAGTSTSFSSLVDNTTYYFKAFSVDASYNYSGGVTGNVTTPTIANTTNFQASVGGVSSINLSWVLNSASDDVLVTYNIVNSFATPTDGSSYTVGNQVSPGQGTVLYKGTATSFNHTGLALNTQYFYKIWSFDCGLNYSNPGQTDNATTSNISDPTNFTATASSSCEIGLGWTPVSGNDVMILRNTTNTFATPNNGTAYTVGYNFAGGGSVVYNGSGTSYTNTSLADNTTYYYKAFTVSSSNQYSSGVNANATTTLIPNPASITATGVSTSQIDLSWPTSGSLNVIVTYNTTGTFTSPVDGSTYTTTIGTDQIVYKGSASSFNHTGLSINTTYYYKIWYYDCGLNYSGTGATDNATTSNITNPTNFTATASSSCEIGLGWTPVSGNDVMILRNTTNTFATPNNGTAYTVGYTLTGGGTVIYKGNGTSYTNTSLVDNTTYYYKAFSVSSSYIYSSGVSANATTNVVPTPATFNATSAGISQIDLAWAASGSLNVIVTFNQTGSFTNPTDGVNYTTSIGSDQVLYKGSATSFNHTGLNFATTYYYKIWYYDCGLNYSPSGTAANATTGNISNPQAFDVVALSSCADSLYWTKNVSNDNVMIAYSLSNNFATPNNGTAYSVGYTFPFGQGTIAYIGSGTNYTHSPLFKNTKYYYKIWSRSSSNFYSTGIIDSVTTNNLSNPQSFTVSSTGTDFINLSCVLNTAGDNIMVVYNTVNNFATPIDGISYNVGNQLSPGQGIVLYKGNNGVINHTGLNLNTTYYYKVWSFDCAVSYSTSGLSVNATTGTVADPQSFTSNAVSSSQIDLSWVLNASNNNVMVAYNTVNSFGTPINGIDYVNGNQISSGQGTVIYNGSATSFSHSSLNMNTVYYYKIWSKDGSSNYSIGLTSQDTTLGVSDPNAFDASTVSASQIDLSWTKNSSSDSVMIVYNTTNNFANLLNGFAYVVGNQVAVGQGTVLYRGSATSFSHTGLVASTKYYYKAYSYNSANYYSTPGLIDSATTMAPGVATFPYFENFDTQVPNQGNLYSCVTYYPLTSGWNNVQSVDDIDWVVRQGTTPNGTWGQTGPIGDHTTGSGYYLYTEASSCYNKAAWLVSPVFNFTALSNPRLEFYYFMLGTGTGSINVQASTDGGATWSSNLFNKSGQQQTSQAAPWGYADISLAAYAGMTNIRLRIKGTTGFNYASDMAIDDIRVYQPQNMVVSSVTTEQDTIDVVLGATNQQVIRVKIETVGAFSPQSVSQLSFNTLGTQDLSDISNARVFYTGSNPNFSTIQQFGSVTANPNGSFNVNGTQVLAEGLNYFWLTYDIPATATIGHVVDARFAQGIISGIAKAPTVSDPPGTKTIIGQITVGTGSYTSYNYGPTYIPYYHGGHEAIYLASELGTGAKEINRIAYLKASGSNTLDKIDNIRIYMKNSTLSTLTSGALSTTGYTLVYEGPMPNYLASGWINVTLTNTFLWDGTSNLHVLVVQDKPATTWSNYPYWTYTSVSPTKARYGSNYSNPVTSLSAISYRPNTRLEYVLPASMSYASSTVEQATTKSVEKGTTNAEILRIKIETNNTANPLNLTKLLLSTAGSTSAADISNAKVYYTGTSTTFATTTQFGSTVVSPSGTFTVNGTQALQSGTNYFWLCYDVSSTATPDNVLDAKCDSITVGGSTYAPTISNPNGNRTIKQYLIIGNGTNSDYQQPLHVYYNHAWEAIYTSTEMGAAKDLSALAFYKLSGSNTVNQILNVTIYMRHTVETTKTSGSYSTAGYTLVYQGNFTNDAPSGWMEVQLTNPFTYNGTDNLEILIVQNYGAYFTGYPYWAYRTVSPNRARFANNYSSAPTSLNASNRLANIRFEYSDPTPMSYVSSTVSQNNFTNVTAGVNDQDIIAIEVVTQNSANPLSATSFTFNTNGSSAPATDISNAKVYFTAGSPTFSAINQFGTAHANPNGTFTITGSQTLQSGTNYFWLAYDIPSTATTGHWVDAECTSLTVGTPRTPTQTAPIGNRTIVGALSGEYTIGAGGDYTTFTSAINALNTYGVAGWVKFRVFSGTYNEQINLSPYTNASATNTVTFEAYTGNAADAILQYSSSNSSLNYTLQVSGAAHYIIKDLTIKANGSTYGRAISLSGNNTDLVFRNNIIVAGSATGTNAVGVYAYNSPLNRVTFASNDVSNGYYSLYIRAASASSPYLNVVIDSNTVNSSYYGIYVYYSEGIKIRNNTFNSTGSSSGYCIYGYGMNNGTDISGNRIIGANTNTAYGLYLYYSNGNSTARNLIYNNFISITGGSGTNSNGVYMNNCSYTDLVYNSVRFAGSYGNYKGAMYFTGGSNNNLKNNMLVSTNNAYALYINNSTAITTSDYNNLFTTGSSLAYYNGSPYSSLAQWVSNTPFGDHSINVNPNYVSATDLHVTNTAINNLGNPYTGITKDIDNDPRDLTTPDIGADEFSVGNDAGVIAIVSPVSGCTSNQTATVELKNFGTNTLTSATINWTIDGTAQTPFSWTGSLTTNSTANVNIGTVNLASGNHTIVAWSVSPNGVADGVNVNDTSTATVNIGSLPTVDAGANATVCPTGTFTTNATASNYTTLAWTTSGTGSFTGGTSLTATYTPSAADITAGSVYLKLTASSAGCGNVADSLLLTIQVMPTVSFTGLAATYCPNDGSSTLVGSPTGGVFSGPGISGNTFNPALAGAGTHTVTYKYTAGSCVDSAQQTTVVAPVITPTISGLASGYCITSPASTLTGTPSGGTWSGAITTNIFNPAVVGVGVKTVTYTVVDPTTSCSFDTTYTTEVYTQPVATISGLNPTYCNNSAPVTVTGSPAGGIFEGSGMTGNIFDPALAGLGSHTIKYIVNNGVGCSDTAYATVTVNAAPNASFSGLANAYCSTDAAVTLIGTPAGGTYTGNGISGTTFTPATAGSGLSWITYTYTAANGCSDSAMQSVTVNQTPVANAGSDISITSGTNTVLSGSATGGSASYSYLWSPAALLQTGNATMQNPTTINLTASQIFTLVVTDNVSGCSSSDQVQVTVNSPVFAVSASGNPLIICEGDSSIIQAVVTGGTGPTSYSWSSNPTGFSSTAASAIVYPTVTTTYTVTATDGTSFANAQVVVQVNPLPVVSISGLGTNYCSNDAPITMIGNPAGGVFNGIGVSGNVFNPSAANIGLNQIVYTYTNTNGCSNSDTAFVTVNQAPIVDAGIDVNIDYNQDTILYGTATGGSGNYSWNWSPASKLIATNTQNVTTTLLTATQRYKLIVTDATTGCSAQDSVLVTVIGGPLSAVVSASPSAICVGGTAQVSAIPSGGDGTYAYQWSSNPAGFTSTNQSPNVSPTATTTYTVTVTSGGQNYIGNAVVTVNPIPVVDFSGLAVSYCLNDPTSTLTGLPSGGVFSGNGVSGNLFNPLTAGIGNHTVTYTYTNPTTGCVGTKDSSTTVYAVPIATAGSDVTINQGQTTTLVGSASGGSGTYSYAWTPAALVVSPTSASTSTVAMTSTTQFILEVTDQVSGCTDTDDKIVTVLTPGPISVSATATPDTICVGDASTLLALASGGNGSYTYSWSSSPSGFTSTSMNPTVSPSVTTTYTVLVSDGSTNANTSVVVTVSPIPVVTISGISTQYCSADAAVNLVGSPSGGLFSGPGVSGNQFIPALAGSGNHTINYSFTSPFGCSNSATHNVTVYQTPVVNAGPDDTVFYNSVYNLGGLATGGSNYSWIWSPASHLQTVYGQNVSTDSLKATQTFTLSVTDTVTGCNSSDDVVIFVKGGPLSVVSATATPASICVGDSSKLSVLPTGGTGTYSYFWASASGFSSTLASPFVSPTVTTVYTYVVTSGPNVATGSVTVTVNPVPVVSFTGLANTYCIDDAPSILTGTPTGGTFSGVGVTGNTFNPSLAGAGLHVVTYSFTNTSGCSAFSTDTTIVYDLPTVNAGTDITLTAVGSTNLSGTVTGGSGSFTYNWTPSAMVVSPNALSTATVSLSASELFTLTATDQVSGCVASDDIQVILAVGPLSVVAQANPDTICAGDVVNLNAIATGGNGIYTYSWSSNPSGFSSIIQNPVVNPTVTTTYTVLVNSGTSNASSSVVVVVNPLPNVSFTGLSSPYCTNDMTSVLTGSPVGGVFSGSGVSGNIFDPGSVAQGSYMISYTYTNPTTGCSASNDQQVLVYEAPVANAGLDVFILPGSDTLLYGSATGGGNYSWAWSPTLMLVNAAVQNPTTVPLFTTQLYTLTVTDTITGCSDNDDVIVSTSTILDAQITANQSAICQGDSVQLNVVATGGTGTYSYSWSSLPMGFASTLQNPMVKPNVTTLYSVTVNDGVQTITKNITITVNPKPAVALVGLSSSTCANSMPDTLLGFPSGGVYSGAGLNSNLFDPTIAGIGTHYISYTYTNANGCSNTDVDTITVNANPIANAGTDTTILVGHDTILYGSGLGGSGLYSYQWSPASELLNAFAQNPTTKNLYLTTLFTLKLTDQNTGCYDTDTVQITVQGGPLSANPMANPDTICYGSSTQLNALVSGGTGLYTYLWSSNPTGFVSNSATPTVAPATTTTFTVIADDGNGAVVNSVVVVVETQPIVQIMSYNPENCSNGGFDTLVASPSGGIFFGNGVTGNFFNPTVAGVGTHQIIYSYTTAGGCSNSDTITTEVLASPAANAGSDIMIPCGGSGGLIGSNPVMGMTYSWSPAIGLLSPFNSNTIANPQTVTNYTLTVTDTTTGCSSTDQVLVDIVGGPTAMVTNDTIICKGESVTISASGGTSFLWNNGVNTSSFTVSPNVTTTYTVTVSDGACSDVDSVTVYVNAPYVDLGPDIVLVDTSSITLDAGYGYLKYLWNTGDTTQAINIIPYVSGNLGLNKFAVAVLDAYGCYAIDSINITYVLSFDELNEEIGMNIYPNPSDGRFIMELNGLNSTNYLLQISTTTGKILYQEDLVNRNTIYTREFDFRDWAKGVYMVKIVGNQGFRTYKLVIN